MRNIAFGNVRLKSPCQKGCPDRFAGCVKTCERLKEYEAEKRKGYDERWAAQETIRRLDEVEKERIRRVTK